MIRTIVKVSTLVSIFTLIACGSSNRDTTVISKNSNNVTCIEPPPDIIQTALSAQIQALIPEINIDIQANASAKSTVERIRSEVPNLQAVEALDYRMCVAYANGVLTKESYTKFLSEILPLLTTSNNVADSKKATDYTTYKDVPVQYGDFTALQQYEQLWKSKLESEGNPNAEAKAFLIAVQLTDIVWSRKKTKIDTDQRIANLRSNINTLSAEEKQKVNAHVTSLQRNIITASPGRDIQLIALYGNDLSVNNPVDTAHEVTLLTNYSAKERILWFQSAKLKYSQII